MVPILRPRCCVPTSAQCLPTSGKLHNWTDRRPLGVVVLITPFNHPLLIAVKKVAPALAAGNSVVLKPSELTPLTSLMLGRLLKEAGVPDGVFSVLPATPHHGTGACGPPARAQGGHHGQHGGWAGHWGYRRGQPGAIHGRVGREGAPSCVRRGRRRRGGQRHRVRAFVASGQTCVAATRILVESALLPRVLERLKSKAASIERRMGAPTNPGSMMGPLISARQLERVEALVGTALASGNAQVEAGGERMSGRRPPRRIRLLQGLLLPTHHPDQRPGLSQHSPDGDMARGGLWPRRGRRGLRHGGRGRNPGKRQ